MALILILIGSAVVARVEGSPKAGVNLGSAEPDSRWSDLLFSYAKSLLYVVSRTVPLVVFGIWVSMWIMRLLPVGTLGVMAGGHAFGIAIVALLAVLLTLPSLFEIPLAMSVLAAGGPLGAAAAVLFAGPAINLPSLLVIGRYSSWKVAVALASLIWVIAAGGGILIR
jgi:uncharacterized membrane protein YraQ (UPF0718 family)